MRWRSRPARRIVGIAQGKQLATGAIDGWGSQSLVDQWNDAATVRWWYGTLDARGTTLHVAKLLEGQPALRVHIVGHTDNQGTLAANLALSRARAQAVADALAKTHRIDPKRLGVAGVASYSPVASNAAEAGRAKNRRVELVVQ
jgi:hypothetical protein